MLSDILNRDFSTDWRLKLIIGWRFKIIVAKPVIRPIYYIARGAADF